MDINNIKLTVLGGLGLLGGIFCNILGGWDAMLCVLLGFMASDYLTGLVVAGVFHNSPKTETGRVESNAGIKGIFRKLAILVAVAMAHMLDIAMGVEALRGVVLCFFVANEGLSIIENIGLMGVPLPGVLKDALEVLKSKSEESGAQK